MTRLWAAGPGAGAAVSAANPLAAQAGLDMLRAGGSAIDAMIAAQLVLGLVEPQSSGLGGGAFLVWYDAQNGRVRTLDGRETAPLAAGPQLFLDENGQPLGFFDAVIGGRAVGVPGVPALLEQVYAQGGRLSWADLVAPALRLAQEGFVVSPRLSAMVIADHDRLSRHPVTRAYFLPNGVPIPEGHILKNPAYAQTLLRLAQHGAAGFYTGDLAQQIVDTVQGADAPGLLSEIDLSLYAAKPRAAVWAPLIRGGDCGADFGDAEHL